MYGELDAKARNPPSRFAENSIGGLRVFGTNLPYALYLSRTYRHRRHDPEIRELGFASPLIPPTG